MTKFVEDLISFDFQNGFFVEKLDAMKFYVDHYSKIQDEKSVDFVAFNPDKSELWLVEVKDYRNRERKKTVGLIDEIAKKISSSLACLIAMRGNSQYATDAERDFAAKAIVQTKLRVVFHLELSEPNQEKSNKFKKQSRSFYVDLKTVRDSLRRTLRPIDPDAIVSTVTKPRAVPWKATFLDIKS